MPSKSNLPITAQHLGASKTRSVRSVLALAGVLLMSTAAACANAGDAQPVKPLGPGAFFIATGPNPFAGPSQAVTDCMFFTPDIDRKINGCSDVLADAAAEPRPNVAYAKLDQRRQANNLAAAHYHRAMGLRQKRDQNGALADLDEAVKLATFAPIFNVRGQVHADLGQFDQAIADFTESLKIDPESAPSHHFRGAAYAQRGKYDLAIADFSEAIRIDPNLTNAYFIRGEIFRTAKQFDRAIEDLTQVIRLDPKHVLAYNSRGEAYSVTGKPDAAIADFEEAIRLAPKYMSPYQNRAVVYYGLGNMDKAIADADDAIRLNPKVAKLWVILAVAWEKAGDRDKAIADYRHTLELDPGNALAMSGLKRLGD